MREKIKILIAVVIIALISLGIISFVEKSQKPDLSGKLTIWTTNSNYKYMETVVENFEAQNKHVVIDIKNLDSKSYFNEVVKSYKEGKEPDIALLNGEQLNSLILKENIIPISIGNVISTYNMNFSNSRVQSVYINGNYYGVPFTSTPLVLYVRNDLLNKYGYNNTDINTWNDAIRIGKDIYKKSNGKVRLINAVGEDYVDLVDLILMENMGSGNDEQDILKNTEDMLNTLKKENIIATEPNSEYAAKIGSIVQMKAIAETKEKCTWTANNPPALVVGGNKFYEAGGENLVSLNKEKENLSEAFISFVTNDTKTSLEYTLSGDVFSSYLYTYKNVKVENQINNFSGKSPLIVMSNITEKAFEIQNYNEYLKLRNYIIDGHK